MKFAAGLASPFRRPAALTAGLLLPVLLCTAGSSVADGTGGKEGSGLKVYELYARVTTYHNGQGDPVNGGPLNFMGRLLVPGRSAAAPPQLAGSLVEIPDFNPLAQAGPAMSAPLRHLLKRRSYDGFFVVDDIGSAITFLSDGRPARWRNGWSLEELSRRSLTTGEAVLRIDVMVPDSRLAESYKNPRCLVRIYQADDLGGMRWIPSPSPVWPGRKPYFDTVRRHREYMNLLNRLDLFAVSNP